MDSPYDAAEGADALLILTQWNEFRALDLKRLAGSMANPRIADFRNIYSVEDTAAAGLEAYCAIGRRGLEADRFSCGGIITAQPSENIACRGR